jgi:hypothetical protein
MNGYNAPIDPEDTNVVRQNPSYYGLPSDDTVKKTQTATTRGRKFDGGKLQYGLIPPLALKETVKVLTFGAVKYDKNNWKKVPDAQSRYYDALQRHLWSWFEGEQLDPETGINHLAHAMCNIMFLLERDLHTEEEWEKVIKMFTNSKK